MAWMLFWMLVVATHRDTVGVLLPDALSLGLALLERVLVLELGTHVGDGLWDVVCLVVL